MYTTILSQQHFQHSRPPQFRDDFSRQNDASKSPSTTALTSTLAQVSKTNEPYTMRKFLPFCLTTRRALPHASNLLEHTRGILWHA